MHNENRHSRIGNNLLPCIAGMPQKLIDAFYFLNIFRAIKRDWFVGTLPAWMFACASARNALCAGTLFIGYLLEWFEL